MKDATIDVAGRASPERLAALRLAGLEISLERDPADLDAESAFEAVAHWGALHRFEPDLVRGLDHIDSVLEMRDLLHDDSNGLMARAVAFAEAQPWVAALDRTRAHARRTGAGVPLPTLRMILAKVDDLDLVAWAAGVHGKSTTRLAEERNAAVAWLLEHARDFAPLAEEIDAAVSALDRELDSRDPTLAVTGEKLRTILARIEPRPPSALAGPASWILGGGRHVAVAAAAEGLARDVAPRTWTSPDGKYSASASIPVRDDALIVFFRRNADPTAWADDLVGRTAVLDGVPAVIQGGANLVRAEFSVRAIASVGRPAPELAVDGLEGLWTADS
jgi:hypothetical protein